MNRLNKVLSVSLAICLMAFAQANAQVSDEPPVCPQNEPFTACAHSETACADPDDTCNDIATNILGCINGGYALACYPPPSGSNVPGCGSSPGHGVLYWCYANPN